MKFSIIKGSTSVILTVFIQDSSSTTGAGLASLDQTSGITGGYVKRNGTGVALAVDQNVTTEGTYEAPTTAAQVRIGTPVNMVVGTYELHVHNDLLTTADWVTITLSGALNMAPLTLEIQLTNFNLNDANPDVNVTQVSGSSATADNLETIFDGVEGLALAYMGPRGPGVYLDDGAGNTNTVNGVDGTMSNHVSTIAAMKTIADSMGIKRVYLVNNTISVLAAAMPDWEIVGIGEMMANTVDLSAEDVDNSAFYNVLISGAQGGTGRFHATSCVLSVITGMEVTAHGCKFAAGTLTLRNDCSFTGCESTVAGVGTPILDVNSVPDVNLYFSNYQGGVQINNAVSTTVMSFNCPAGQLIIGATCTSISIVPRGIVTFTDLGTTTNLLTKDAAVNLTNVNAEIAGFGTATGGTINIEAIGDNTTRDTVDNAAAVDKGGGLVGIPVTGHAFIVGREVTITDTTNYDASYEIISETTNEVVITATYMAETFAGTETINASVKGIEFVGTITANTYLNTAHPDGVTHDMDDVGDVIDIVYIYAVGGGRTGMALSLVANLNGNADELAVQGYNFVASAWETLEILSGSGGSSFVALNPDLLNRNTGTGTELGDVFIRFATASTSPDSLEVDKLTVAAANIGQSVGYANGAVWINTASGTAGTEPFVNGVADNPVDLIASAKTIASTVGVSDFHVINGSTVTFAANSDNESYFGDNWTLLLDGQSCVGLYVSGAAVSGVGTAASGEMHFEGCDVSTMSCQTGHFDFCGFDGTVTMTLAGDYNFHDCYSKVAGAGSPTFTKTAGQAITGEWRRFSGSVTVSGIEAGDTFTISGELGTVTLNGADGTVEIRGTYKNIVDNRTGSPTLNTDGAIKGVDVASILADTAVIGAAGVGLTNLGGMSTSMKAEVESEANDALVAQKLDHLVAVADSDDPVDNSIMAKLATKAATADWSDFVNTTDSLEALRDRGDAAWTTGSGTITDILNVVPLVPTEVDLADTATVQLGLMLTNAIDDLPSTAEITPGTIDIDRKAVGGTAWTSVVSGAACSEIAGLIYYDEVFDAATGYIEGDSLRITFKSQKITVAANDYEIIGTTGRIFYSTVRQTERGTDSAALASALTSMIDNELTVLQNSVNALGTQFTQSVAPNVASSSSSSTSTGFLGEIEDRVRQYIDEPGVGSKYTSADILRFVNDAWEQIYQDLNQVSDVKMRVRHTLTISGATDFYELPPNIGQFLSIEKVSTSSQARVLWELLPGQPLHPYGPGFTIEGNTLRLEPPWESSHSMRLVYVPKAETAAHEGVLATVDPNGDGTKVILAATPTTGTLDTRLNAYAGYIFRLLSATYPDGQAFFQQERQVTVYDASKREATLSTALNPVPEDDADVTYEIVPQTEQLCKHIIACKVARFIAAAYGDTVRMKTLNTEYHDALRSLRGRLSAFQGRTGKRMPRRVRGRRKW